MAALDGQQGAVPSFGAALTQMFCSLDEQLIQDATTKPVSRHAAREPKPTHRASAGRAVQYGACSSTSGGQCL